MLSSLNAAERSISQPTLNHFILHTQSAHQRTSLPQYLPFLNEAATSPSLNPLNPNDRATSPYCFAMGWRGVKSVPKASKQMRRFLWRGMSASMRRFRNDCSFDATMEGYGSRDGDRGSSLRCNVRRTSQAICLLDTGKHMAWQMDSTRLKTIVKRGTKQSSTKHHVFAWFFTNVSRKATHYHSRTHFRREIR